jgi:hypothetical protein
MSGRVSNRFETDTAKNAVPFKRKLGCSGIAAPRTLAFGHSDAFGLHSFSAKEWLKDQDEHMTQAEGPLSKTTILGLVAMALAVLVVADDFTALSVALPAMEQDFGADVTTVQSRR